MKGAPFDAMAVLGVELDADDMPTQEFCRRVMTAVHAYNKGMLKPEGRIVVCGGTLEGHAVAEADVMARLLERQGVPAACILREDQSQDTMENLRFAYALLGSQRRMRLLVVTSDYHLRRALMTARRVGFDAKGLGAALAHDRAWRILRCKELLYTLDLVAGWQDEGKSRPAWTYSLLEKLFG